MEKHLKRLSLEEFNSIYSRVPRLCVDLAVITDKGIVLTKRKITPYNGMWHTPGGTVLKGESLSDAVKRVAEGEIGVEVKIEKLLGPMEALNDGKTGRHTVSLYFLVTPKLVNFYSNEQSSQIKIFSSLPKNIISHQRKVLTKYLGFK